MATAAQIVAQAKTWLGCKESNGTHKKIIDIYNGHAPLARSYKVKYTDAWCATFVSAVAIKCGATDIIPTECSCQKQIELFKALGTWHENENMRPQPGDIVYYDWQDSGFGDNKGVSDHVGIVESVSTTSFVVIEGNYSNAVKRRTMSINGRYIRGFARPAYGGSVAAPSASVNELAKRVIAGDFGTGADRKAALGDRYDEVQARVNELLGKADVTANETYTALDKTPDTIAEVQVYLNQYYGWNLKVTGIYDTATKKALVKEVQEIIGTTADGYFQTKSKAAWGNRLVQNGSSGILTLFTQMMLICRGYSVGECGADGECGNDTVAAIKKYQKANGLTVDGQCGKNTATKLFG